MAAYLPFEGSILHWRILKRISRAITFCCVFAVFLVVGYYVGMTQNRMCEICVDKLKTNTQVEKPSYQTVLLVLIFSAAKNVKQRIAARETWLLTKGDNSILHLFVIGLASLSSGTKKLLATEDELNNDLLLLEDVDDTYSLLSRKLLGALKWVDTHVSHSFMLKVDDDSFVRLNSLLDELNQQSWQRLYMGFFDGRSPIHQRGKWKEENWFLCDTFLPYAKGGGYVLSYDLVNYLAKNSDYWALYKSEDVSLGVWLSPLNIRRVHNPKFDTEYKSRGCFNAYLVTHKQSEAMMIEKYNNLITTGNMCLMEKRTRLSYMYNWKVPPSLCCIRNNNKIP